MADEMDKVFKALADPNRRLMLDRLHGHDGQSLGTLCKDLEMSRQAASQHLAVLEAANLVVTVREGREKRHYLNPIPIRQISDRWIGKFEQSRVNALIRMKTRLEGD